MFETSSIYIRALANVLASSIGLYDNGALSTLSLNVFNGGGSVRMMRKDGWYGLSIVCHSFSYGGDAGLFEIAVLDGGGEITYTTSITNDVLGYVSFDELPAIIGQMLRLDEHGIDPVLYLE